MTKPREFWINYTGCDDFITDDKRTGESNNCIHVIEKQAADKLAEALSEVMKVSGTSCAHYHIAMQALKDYRGEK